MNDSKRTRRRHGAELKAQVLSECAQPGASVASVAMSHGINANVVHKWRRLASAAAAPAADAGCFVHTRCVAGCGDWAAAGHSRGASSRCNDDDDHLAECGGGGVRCLDARAASVIRIEAIWLAVEPLDMRAGTEAALARVVRVFGAARPHHAYLFANRRANRMKVLVHDGIGVWLAARRLNQGKFVWPNDAGPTLGLTRAQLDALVLGLPWQRIGEAGVITVL